MPTFLVPCFFIIALLYSIVGFGGGSSYIAIMALANIPYENIPALALICNVIVVSGGCYHYSKAGYVKKELIWPFVVSSIPMAYLGGLLVIPKIVFLVLLGTVLFLAGIRLLIPERKTENFEVKSILDKNLYKVALPLGGLLGFVSGVIGIGGGIFLAPVLHILKLASAKQIAATTSFFILLNSLAGLLGQLQKNIIVVESAIVAENVLLFVLLPLSVFIGGQVGSRLGAYKINPVYIKQGTGILILLVSLRILFTV